MFRGLFFFMRCEDGTRMAYSLSFLVFACLCARHPGTILILCVEVWQHILHPIAILYFVHQRFVHFCFVFSLRPRNGLVGRQQVGDTSNR